MFTDPNYNILLQQPNLSSFKCIFKAIIVESPSFQKFINCCPSNFYYPWTNVNLKYGLGSPFISLIFIIPGLMSTLKYGLGSPDSGSSLPKDWPLSRWHFIFLLIFNVCIFTCSAQEKKKIKKKKKMNKKARSTSTRIIIIIIIIITIIIRRYWRHHQHHLFHRHHHHHHHHHLHNGRSQTQH